MPSLFRGFCWYPWKWELSPDQIDYQHLDYVPVGTSTTFLRNSACGLQLDCFNGNNFSNVDSSFSRRLFPFERLKPLREFCKNVSFSTQMFPIVGLILSPEIFQVENIPKIIQSYFCIR